MRPLLPGRFRLALSQQLITIRGLSPVALGAKAPIFGPPVEDSKPAPDTKGPSEKERLPSETLLLFPIGHLPIIYWPIMTYFFPAGFLLPAPDAASV